LSESSVAQITRLIGAQLTGVGRATGLQHFTFGLADGAQLHLHTEIPWRLTDHTGILGGRADYWRPATPDISEAALDAGEIGATLRDVRNAAVRERIALEEPTVIAAAMDRFGGLLIDFSNGMRLELFPDASSVPHDDWEFWRLFERGQPHYVVGTDGPSSHG
jgi:nitrogen fixation protein